MKKLLIFGASSSMTGSVESIRILNLRQGLRPVLSEEPVAFIPQINTYGSRHHILDISPDCTKIAGTDARNSSTANSTMTYWDNVTEEVTFQEAKYHTSTYGGLVRCCACSNTHRAYGGTAPFLLVFEHATSALVAMDATGLGEVQAMAFSPDGSKLAVAHATAPRLRIYNMADGTFINASANVTGASPNTLCWAPDGESVFVGGGTSNPRFSIAAAATGAVNYTNTGTTQFISVLCAQWSEDGSYIMIGASSNSTMQVAKFTVANRAFTALAGSVSRISTSATSSGVQSLALDEEEGLCYLIHNSASGEWETVSRFRIASMDGMEGLGLTIATALKTSTACLRLLKKNTGRLIGTVRDISNTPVQRNVYAFDEATKELLAKTQSDSLTGNYSLLLPNTRPVAVRFESLEAENLNDLFFARSEPEPI